MKNKIVILGAGLSGVYCGFLLQQLGYQATILEARDRVGGRTYTTNGIDLGGTWVSSLHYRVMKLCEQFNISVYRQFEEGIFVKYFNQQREKLYGKHNIIKSGETSDPLAPLIKRFLQLTDGNDFFEQQKDLDQISFYDWCIQNTSNQTVIKSLLYSFSVLTCIDPKCGSFFFWLYFLKSCGGFAALVGIKEGAQEFRIEGGAQTLSNKLAENLLIVYHADVTQVEKHDEIYYISTQDEKTYTADQVICTIPAQLIPKIVWKPRIEKSRLDFYHALQMGSVTKVVIEYDLAFWRLDGYNAQIVSDTPPIYLAYDACDKSHNAIVIFIVNDIGYTNAQIVDQLAFLLDNDLAKTPRIIHRKNWADDPLSGGCYFCIPPVNSLAKNQHYLSAPYGSIYFAGTETANEWMGYMEGALESAERTVAQITTMLNH